MSEAGVASLSSRRRAAMPGSHYERAIEILKKILPFLSGMMAAILLLFPLTHADELSFMLAKDQVDVAGERLKVSEALYRGEDRRGQPFVIRAQSALQKSSRDPIVQLQGLSAAIRMKDGDARVVADHGRYDMGKETVDIDGPIRLRSQNGYSLDTRDVVVDLPERKAVSNGPVDGKMPLGTFAADRLEADIEDRTVVLSGRARLHIVQRQSR